jgi:hypothetical protein
MNSESKWIIRWSVEEIVYRVLIYLIFLISIALIVYYA